ncbi:peroxiredoxin [Truepera radiovictrix]|uniref:thioredoxin-dependent peroxiredoxin n=1 Tax=Truepera radiovictrix (strain DSM 17093 / CIP 108686 / LMG 22925 / RQ-24) TaxID=649638 RepID=D7CXW5_TRURR|nr:peroxiredoxin [Truepera radiovictrix]ADI13325.1 Peroxiredoxin [Truepera radiovictrix DSM 17093]WMT58110.1 peroxiredoxin [Truepera radiovictrix]
MKPPARLQPGDRAPDFALRDASGRTVALRDLLGKGPVVVYFYPKDNTKGCTAQACAFRDHYLVFKEAGAEVVGISTDSEASHRAFAEQHDLPFILLSDPKGEVARAYGATALLGLMTGRVSFVLDERGTVRHVFNDLFHATRHVDEALKVVRALSAAGQTPAAAPPHP